MNSAVTPISYFLFGIGALALLFVSLQSDSSVSVKEDGSRLIVSVDGGETEAHYSRGPLTTITIHPIMRQRYGIGVPKLAGIGSQIYYVSTEQLARKRRSYTPDQACFDTFGPGQMGHLLVVGDQAGFASKIPYRTPQLDGGESTVTIQGYYLNPVLLTKAQREADPNWSSHFSSDRKLFFIKSIQVES